jgi:Pyridoxamine 5'-phosphate oxidase
MVTWAELETQLPSVAQLGRKLLIARGRGFLATTRADGSPRVQAICPVVRDGRLYAAIIKATPKYADLLRDGRFALHAPLAQGDAEFWITGVAHLLSETETETLMADNPEWQMPVANAMFHLDIRTAHGTIFKTGPQNLPVPDRRSFWASHD